MTPSLKIPTYITLYAWFITLFTSLMVFMSLFAAHDFFIAYQVTGDKAFQLSWSFRYLTVLILMLLGLLQKQPQTLFMTILARFCIDVFDGIGVMLFNTPPFSFEWLAFHLCVLLGPQLFCLYQLARLSWFKPQ